MASGCARQPWSAEHDRPSSGAYAFRAGAEEKAARRSPLSGREGSRSWPHWARGAAWRDGRTRAVLGWCTSAPTPPPGRWRTQPADRASGGTGSPGSAGPRRRQSRLPGETSRPPRRRLSQRPAAPSRSVVRRRGRRVAERRGRARPQPGLPRQPSPGQQPASGARAAQAPSPGTVTTLDPGRPG